MRGDDRVNLYEENKIKHKKIVKNTDRIIAMHNEGKKTTEIAKVMGVSPPSIYYLLLKKGIINRVKKSRPLYRHKKKVEQGDVKPFMERISPELRAMIKRNTEINNIKIKRPGSMIREEEKELVGSIAEMTITNVV